MTWWTSDADLENLFSKCGGSVIRVFFEEEKANGKSKGIATVEFSDRYTEPPKKKPRLSSFKRDDFVLLSPLILTSYAVILH
jgi:hypothetical protein